MSGGGGGGGGGAQQAGASAGGPRAREAAQLGTTASRPDQELVPRILKVSRVSFLFSFLSLASYFLI